MKDTAEPPAELTEFAPEVSVNKLWQRDIGEGSGRFLVDLKPLISGDKLFISDHEGRVTAYDRMDGKKLWREKLRLSVSAALGEGEALLYLGTRDGQVVAVDKTTGERVWQAQLSGEVLSVPVEELGMVVAQTVDGAIHGMSASSGEVLWSNRRSVPPLTLRGTGQPVIVDGLILTGMDNGRLIAVSLLEGNVIWEAPLGIAQGRNEIERVIDADMRPVVDQGIVYGVAYQGRTAAVAMESGRVLWARDISALSGVSLDQEGSLFLGDEHSQIWGLDKRNGATLWVQDKMRARYLTRPASVDRYLVSGDFEGYIHVLDTADGRLVGRVQYDDEGYIAPAVVVDGVVYMVDREGELTAFTLEALES